MADVERTRELLQISCADSLGLMTDHVEESLSPADGRRMASHLAGCEPCSVFLGQLRATIRIVGALDPAPDPDAEPQRVERLVELLRSRNA